MLKPDERQGSFYDPEYICEQLIPQDSFYRKFRQKQKIRVRSTHFTFHKLMLIPLISEVKGIINISYEQEDRRLFCEMCRPLEGYNVLTFTNPLNTTTVTKGGERGQVLKNKLLPTIITHCGKTDPNGFAVSNTYDPAGNIKTLTYPGNLTVTYTYDNLNRLKTVTDWLGRTASYTYDNAGRLTSLVQFNGTVVTYGYDNANRMTSLDNTTSSGTAIAVYAYTLDNDGNRTGINQTVPLTMN